MRVAAAWWARPGFSQRTTWPLTSSTCRQNSSGRLRQTSTEIGSGWALLEALAEVCVQRGYRRFEWSVLGWNEPSIRFYRSIGAVGMDEWKLQRLSGDALTRLATS